MPFPVIPYDEWEKMGQYVQLEDGNMFYVHKGKGFPLVIGHSFGKSSFWHSRVLDAFAREYSVYVMDNPGCGRSEEPPLPYSIENHAEAVIEFMDRLGIDRAHYLGCSGSSQIGVHLASTWPSRVSKLVLDCPVHWTRADGKRIWKEYMRYGMDENGLPRPYDGRSERRTRQWIRSVVAEQAQAGFNDHSIWWEAIKKSVEKPQVFQFLDEETRKKAFAWDAAEYTKTANWWAVIVRQQLMYDINPRLHLIRAPTLWVAGENSPPYGLPEQALVDAVRGSRMEIIPQGGNVVAFEQPENYSKIVLDFLRSPN
jgi:pimeloyl-ACP methyl ester carboxylesterase